MQFKAFYYSLQVHLPSCTVFSNFPVIKKKNISLVHTMDFSPRSGYFALGNEKGKALMYRWVLFYV